jgi:hypothetical protein
MTAKDFLSRFRRFALHVFVAGGIASLLCATAITATAQTADALMQQAIAQRDAGDYDDAAASFRKAIRANPNNARAHYLLGVVYLQQNKDALAKASLLRAAALDPTSQATSTIAKYASRLAKVDINTATAEREELEADDLIREAKGGTPATASSSAPRTNAAATAKPAESSTGIGASIGIAAPTVRPQPAPTVAPAATAAPRQRTASSASASAGEQPPPAKFVNGAPVGLYYMQRMWIATHSLEKAIWYFSPDGKAYENLSDGFSAADLAAHKGRKGTYKVSGDTMTITWADGTSSSSKIERDTGSSTGFAWDMGLFTAASPFTDTKRLAGKYEGGISVGSGGNLAMVSNDLELRADGTYSMGSASSINSTTDRSTMTVGGSGENTGTWSASGYSLTLTDSKGTATRRIAFPWDDEKTAVYPDYLFWGGMMFKKKG